jgi:hypothetical protein
MKLLFGGDLAWPAADAVACDALQALCADARLVVNLEGAILAAPAQDSAVHNEHKFNVYCHPSVAELLVRLNVVACGLANNHIADYVGGVGTSQAVLAAHGIAWCGTRQQPWCRFQAGERDYVLWAACSPLPEPRAGNGEDHALIFEAAPALRQLRVLRAQFPQATLVAYMHWGYELATCPQPADREWARQAIDAGVDLVIGHHPHVVQGLEPYRHGWIAYSLGNLVLPQADYRGRRLHYKTAAVCQQLLLELDDGTLRAHWLQYDPAAQQLHYQGGALAADDARLRALTPYAGMDDAAYRDWFARTALCAGSGRAPLTFWSYRGWGRVATTCKLAALRAKFALRKLAITSGLHKPYNW